MSYTCPQCGQPASCWSPDIYKFPLRQAVAIDANFIYEQIKHGDETHRAWLKEALENVFAGKPVPPPTPSPVAPGWQPIETAPRDGTRVDIWYDGERYTDCVWLPVRHCFVFDDSDGMRQRIDGTHWMPLPEPPSPPDSPGAEDL